MRELGDYRSFVKCFPTSSKYFYFSQIGRVLVDSRSYGKIVDQEYAIPLFIDFANITTISLVLR